MKIEVSKKEFVKALQVGGALAGINKILPILECVKIKVGQDRMTFVSSDNENAISKRLTMGVTSDEEGTFCVNMRDLMSYVKLIKVDTFEINVEEKQLEVKHENGNLILPVLSADDFPQMSTDKETVEVSIDADLLSNWITESKAFVANDEFRPTMNGMYMYCENGEVGCCATNGQSLFTDNAQMQNIPDFKFILNKNAFNPILDAISETNEVTLKIGEHNVMFVAEGVSVIARQIEGRYVNFKSVIPQNNDIEVIVDKKELIDAMSRCSIGANKSSMLTKMSVNGFTMDIECEDFDFNKRVVEHLTVDAVGNIIIGMKYSLIMDALATIKTDKVVITMKDPSRAAIFKNNDVENNKIILIMPMLLQD